METFKWELDWNKNLKFIETNLFNFEEGGYSPSPMVPQELESTQTAWAGYLTLFLVSWLVKYEIKKKSLSYKNSVGQGRPNIITLPE